MGALGLGLGLGLRGRRSSLWTPRQLGATWTLGPVTVDGSGDVLTAADAGGGAVTLASTSGQYFAAVTDSQLGASIRTNNTSGVLTSATGGPTGASPWHLILIARRNAVGASPYSSCFGLGGIAAAQNVNVGCNASGNWYCFDDLGGVANPFSIAGLDANSYPYVLEAIYSGGVLSLYLDGRATGQTQTTTLALSSATFGLDNWYTEPSHPVLDATILGATLLTGGTFTRAQVQSYLRWVCRRTPGCRVVQFFGDSWTAGGATGTTAAHYWAVATRAQQTGANVLWVQDCGVSGKRLDEILAIMVANSDPATDVHLAGSVNDILQNLPAGNASTGIAANDAALMYAIVGQAVALAHARGCKITCATQAQWNLTTGSYGDQVRVAYNGLLRANTARANGIDDIDTAMGPYQQSRFGDAPLFEHPDDGTYDTIIAPCTYAAIVAT